MRRSEEEPELTELELLAEIADKLGDIHRYMQWWWVLFWIGLGLGVMYAVSASRG